MKRIELTIENLDALPVGAIIYPDWGSTPCFYVFFQSALGTWEDVGRAGGLDAEAVFQLVDSHQDASTNRLVNTTHFFQLWPDETSDIQVQLDMLRADFAGLTAGMLLEDGKRQAQHDQLTQLVQDLARWVGQWQATPQHVMNKLALLRSDMTNVTSDIASLRSDVLRLAEEMNSLEARVTKTEGK